MQEFRVRKNVSRTGKRHPEWVAMRKGVAYLFRYREVSLSKPTVLIWTRWRLGLRGQNKNLWPDKGIGLHLISQFLL